MSVRRAGSSGRTIGPGRIGAPSYPSAVLTDSPKAWWRQGEASGASMLDASGNAHHGAYTSGTVTLGATGLTAGDTAATYGGGSGRVTYGSWMDGGASLAVDALILPSSVAASSYNFIVNAADPGTSGPWWLVLHNGKLEFAIGTNSGGFIQLAGATTISAGTKYHVGAIYDGATASVWVNGVQDGSVAKTGTISVTSKDLWIGNWQTASLPFAGVIDEVALYGSLTPTRMGVHATAA